MSDSSNDAGDLSLSCSVSSIESEEIPPQFVHLSVFVAAHSLQEQSADALNSLFHMKTAKLGIKLRRPFCTSMMQQALFVHSVI